MYASRLDRWIKLAAVGAMLALGVGSVTVLARAAPTPPGTFETKAKHAILMDADANLVLFEKDADTLAPPASMSKLMTLAIVFRELKAGRLKLEDQFKVSEHAWRTGGAPSGGSAMFAPLNTMVSISDLIQGITVQSGNDAAIILAEGIGGTEEAFAKQMTEYSRTIGLEKSTFVNATGLPAEGHLMTARDLATLAHHLIYTYPEYYHFFGEKEFKYRDKFVFHNRNPLIVAGYRRRRTEDRLHQGVGLWARGERQARRPAAAARGQRPRHGEGPRGRVAQAARLGLQELQAVPPVRRRSEGERRAGVGRHAALRAAGRRRQHQHHPARRRRPVRSTASIVYNGPIKAPIRKGDQVAVLRVTSTDSQATNDIPLYAGDDIGQSNFAMRGLDSLLVLAFGWLL